MSAPSPPNILPPPIPSGSSKGSGSSSLAADVLKNPGEYEEIGKKVKDHGFPTFIEGCKIVLQKGLSQHFQTSHTLTMGSSTNPAQWQFGATYVGSKKVSENDFRPIMLGEIATSGNFGAMFLHQFGKAWKLKCTGQTHGSKWVGYQTSLDYLGSDFTASLTVANPDIVTSSGVAVAQYLQSITPRLSIGTELLLQKGGDMEMGLLSLGGAYKSEKWEATAKLGMHAWNLTYLHKSGKDLSFFAECDGNLMSMESVAAVGYKTALGGDSFSLRGRVDTKWTVGALIEKRLDPLPAYLLLSGQLNHQTNESKFGIGFMIG